MSAIDPSIGPDQARELFRAELAEVRTDAALQALRTRWVGRKGSWVAAFMEALATATPDQKKALGRGANELKKEVEAALAELETTLAATRRPANAVDITLPGRVPQLGYRHPLSLVRDEVIEIFTRLGYQVLEGPEIEDDYHNFEALNMPAEHPARDMHDTLYLQEPLKLGNRPLSLLRTHTSAMQIRHMEQNAPPVRLVAIGPVYRKDNLDLTHTPMFHQVEGLVVGKGITLADLKGTLSAMARALFGIGGGPLPSQLLPVYRAECRGRHPLLQVRGRRLLTVQAHGMDRDSRQRHGASRGVRSRRLQPRRDHRLRVRHGCGARLTTEVGRWRYPFVL